MINQQDNLLSEGKRKINIKKNIKLDLQAFTEHTFLKINQLSLFWFFF